MILLNGFLIPNWLNNPETSCSLMNLDFLYSHTALSNNSMIFPFLVSLYSFCTSSNTIELYYSFNWFYSLVLCSSLKFGTFSLILSNPFTMFYSNLFHSITLGWLWFALMFSFTLLNLPLANKAIFICLFFSLSSFSKIFWQSHY